MASAKTGYAAEPPQYHYNVTFIVNATSQKLTRSFESEYLAWKFVNKLKYSKRCTLVSCPLFK